MKKLVDVSDGDKAQILVNALPYIQKYYNRIVVVKYGGNAMINEELKNTVMRDIVLLSTVGIKVVLVHGGGPEISDMLKRLNIKSEFVGGLRRTSGETMDVVQMVLAGKINKGLVTSLMSMGGKAMGLSGADGGMIVAEKLHGEVDLGYVGEIKRINTEPILHCLANGYTPVIATLGVDAGGNTYNINADTAASRIAAALGAKNMILMTDIKGLLEDVNDESSLIEEVGVSDVPSLKRKGIISGGMIPKIDCCVEAIRRGVEQALIIDGRVPHSILIELLTDKGVGTLFK